VYPSGTLQGIPPPGLSQGRPQRGCAWSGTVREAVELDIENRVRRRPSGSLGVDEDEPLEILMVNRLIGRLLDKRSQ